MSSQETIDVRTDAAGRVVHVAGPGLVDLQINGYGGLSFNGPVEEITVESLRACCEKIRRRGVVAVLATLITDDAEVMIARARRLAELRAADGLIARTIAGLHIEGPMINPEDGPRGAHPRRHVIAPADRPGLPAELQEASGGLVRIFSVAPEMPGAIDFIAAAARAGVVVSLAHHAAGADVIDRAVQAGASMCTHLGNGTHAMLPRLDNYVMRQLADDRLAAGFIPDGHHLPFGTLKNFIRAKQPARSFLVTDAILCADMPPGEYAEGDARWTLSPDGAVRLPGTPFLAGSALTLDVGVLNAVRHADVTFRQAWEMASTLPASLAGLGEPERIEVDVTDAGFAMAS